MLYIITGLVIGGCLGVVLMGLICGAKNYDEMFKHKVALDNIREKCIVDGNEQMLEYVDFEIKEINREY